jgi:hypothetical protein
VQQECSACAAGVATARQCSTSADTGSERSSRQSSQGTAASIDALATDAASTLLNKRTSLHGVDLSYGTTTDACYTTKYEQKQQQQQQQQQLMLKKDCNSALDGSLLQRFREASLCNTATTSVASQHCVSTPLGRTLCSEFAASDEAIAVSTSPLRYGRSHSSSSSATDMPGNAEVVTESQQQTAIGSITIQAVSSVQLCWRHAASSGNSQQHSDTSCVRCIHLVRLARADKHYVQRALLTWRTGHQRRVTVSGRSLSAAQRAYKHSAHRSLKNGLQKFYAHAFVSITLAKIAATHCRLRTLCTLFAQWKQWSMQRSRCAVRYAARKCLSLWRSRSSSSVRAKQCDAFAVQHWQSTVLQQCLRQWQQRAHSSKLQSTACSKGEAFSDTGLLATGRPQRSTVR